jgi:hypothetical protein
MLAGLMHDIGKFYILSRADDFPELFANSEALKELLNAWHTGVGRAIVEAWGFPEQIANAVDEHELICREKFENADITDIVIVANRLANADEAPATEYRELDQIPSLLRMKTDGETIRGLTRIAHRFGVTSGCDRIFHDFAALNCRCGSMIERARFLSLLTGGYLCLWKAAAECSAGCKAALTLSIC